MNSQVSQLFQSGCSISRHEKPWSESLSGSPHIFSIQIRLEVSKGCEARHPLPASPVRGRCEAALGTISLPRAQVVELVDALASGASVRKDVKVRVLSWAPCKFQISDFGLSERSEDPDLSGRISGLDS